MFEMIDESMLAALLGAGGGILLGLAARLGRFCTLGAIEDALYGKSYQRIGMWGVGMSVAIIGTHILIWQGLLDTNNVVYLSSGMSLFAAIIGGLLFGYGMALSGNCGYGALARLGGGDLRSLVVVATMGLGAYVTLAGPLAPLRVAIFGTGPERGESFGIVQLIEKTTAIPAWSIGILVGIALLVACVTRVEKSERPNALIWGAVVGLAIISGWAGSQWAFDYSFGGTTVVSHSFSAPVGETMLYLMTSTGSSLSFGIGSVAGVLAGAFVGSLIKGHFRWEACEDPRELRRQISGAFVMGVGAVLAVGCSVGQGLSGMSVLSFSAPLVLASIFIGARLGLKQLIEGQLWPAE